MPRSSYQYETSPRKYEPDYITRKNTRIRTNTTKTQRTTNTEKKNVQQKKKVNSSVEKKMAEKRKKEMERKNKTKQVVVVFAIFGMLLALSYREIAIMEMFNQKKDLENQLAVVEKENGQVEKSIKEVESTLDWNKIKQVASEQLGMQVKTGKPIDLQKSDNVEVENTFIQEEQETFLEKIIKFIINR